MNTDRLDALRERGLLAGRHLADERAALEVLAAEPARPGDVFAVPGGEMPLEWVVLQSDPAGRRRLLVVPADLLPLAGSADVVVPAGSSAGPLTLRCRFGVWLEAARLHPRNRTGFVDAEHVARALARVRGLDEGEAVLDPEAAEVDHDPEYRDWIAQVQRRVTALTAAPGRPGRVSSFAWPAVAAALLLAVLPLAFALLRARREAATLRNERQSLEVQQRQQRDTWVGERRRMEEDAAQRLAEAQAGQRLPGVEALGRGAVLNAPFRWLSPRTRLRGQPDVLALAEDAPLVVLILDLEEPPRFGTYRLEIEREGGGPPVFRADGLRPTSAAELSVALPGSLLSTGAYRLRVLGMAGGRGQPVHDYALTVERPGGPSASRR